MKSWRGLYSPRGVGSCNGSRRCTTWWNPEPTWRLAPPFIRSLQWRHIEHDCVSNHQPHDCLLNCLFNCRSKKTSKLRVTGLYEGNSSVTGEFPAQSANYAENVSIWWRHHVCLKFWLGAILYIIMTSASAQRSPTASAPVMMTTIWGPFYWHGLTLIPACISNHMLRKVWDKITHPSPNINGYTVEVWEWISNFTPHFIMDAITCWD